MSISFMKRGTKSGFTLIELLVVIAIIGVLASIVLASLNTARRKARDARRITDIKQIQLALELYYDGQTPVPGYPFAFPNTLANCDPDEAFGLEELAPTYIPQIPRDPNRTGVLNCYRYATPTASGVQQAYHLAAQLEDTATAALSSDRDCDSLAAGGGCGVAGYVGGFDGGVTALDDAGGMYDVTP